MLEELDGDEENADDSIVAANFGGRVTITSFF
jgi:hypothetical protein